jgi:hypothetical protein
VSDPEVLVAFDKALATMSSAGATIIDQAEFSRWNTDTELRDDASPMFFSEKVFNWTVYHLET